MSETTTHTTSMPNEDKDKLIDFGSDVSIASNDQMMSTTTNLNNNFIDSNSSLITHNLNNNLVAASDTNVERGNKLLNNCN